ncbi:carrier superfamily protein [Acanthamoeba castellanii str. Neff]|uniref:Carrier superfamily protein n=1 Tax=Acanthamoeba castellanii (strain ATCC 30010 / Neff) TaxID=1257118 RepID=L8GNP3_ACACF|nr:carrier superfamily protein [Acanthamoeba castellanii str. Neff]XP_004336457.1 carrier superfamily protein [Acanthamoeba castellanii str. Neff]ELR11916.1 carrier superfamily protein [Acanthamoeba castellanii str. Neff]ELR14444.1 carrier superfamily protein [Acanthamoeba castellanii str. Neff]
MSHSDEKSFSVARTLFTGTVSGIVCKFVEQPFDTIKVRVQAGTKVMSPSGAMVPEFNGPWDCFVKTLRREGFTALYKGLPSPMIGSAMEVASMFVVYNAAKEALMDPETHHVSLPRVCLAGSIAGVATATFLTPVELIKCRLQVQTGGEAGHAAAGAAARGATPPAASAMSAAAAGGAQQQLRYRGTMHCIMHTLKTEGIPGLWRGWWSTFFRELVGTALWFGTYETVCRTLAADAGDASDAPPLIQLLAGGCAGCIYWGVPYPMDTVKSRIQIKQATEQTSIFKMFVEVLKEEGVRGLYRGIGPTMMRAIPGSAVALFTYERSSRFLDWLKEEKPHLCPSFF